MAGMYPAPSTSWGTYASGERLQTTRLIVVIALHRAWALSVSNLRTKYQ